MTALSTLSTTRNIADVLKSLNVPHRTFAKLVGVSTGTLSKYVNGEEIPNKQFEIIYRAVRLIEELVQKTQLPLDFHPRNGEHFKLVLDALDKGQWRIEVEDLTADNKISKSAAQFNGLDVLAGHEPASEPK
jgi:predicted transcriptional regulator